MQNDKSAQLELAHSADVAVIDGPRRSRDRVAQAAAPREARPALRAKLAEAEKLSAQSFEIMRRQSAMIQGLKASKEALIASEKELNAANTELTAENGRLSVTVLRLQTTLSTKQKEFTNIVDNQNVMISRLLNLPPKADDMS
jgi:hypothetical protein